MFQGTKLFTKVNKQAFNSIKYRSKVFQINHKPYSIMLKNYTKPNYLKSTNLLRYSTNRFCTQADLPKELKQEKPQLKAKNSQKLEFKAETKKLLDIVAKSIYTDKEVFIRELMSNSSDALEKQRINEVSGVSEMLEVPLEINVITNERQRTITILDHGIGMTKDEIIDNLGTIAKSGSQNFVDALDDNAATGESIIGQFGVGFYSSFIVADSVEVVSKSDSDGTIRWTSDGSGDFEVSEVDGTDMERGTRVTLYLKPE